MALDRQSIEKRDFPIARRGYEPDAVDGHLRQVAEQVERLQAAAASGGDVRTARAGVASLAAAASEQVRAIVEAAETTAEQIEAAAREEADEIRRSAQADAERARADAVQSSEEHVGKVAEATRQMLQRVDAMENELHALVDSLRTGANRLSADLSLLQGNMGDLYDAAGAEGRDAAPVAPPVSPPPETEVPVAEPEPDFAPADAEPDLHLVEPEAPAARRTESDREAPEPATQPGRPTGAGGGGTSTSTAAAASGGRSAPSSGDTEGARLVALNMALNGQSREETDRYLAENFDLQDRQGLLDEVYSTVEG